ncbi:hypothetical protein ACPV52_09900 [Vibrio astriarenae]
MTYCVEIDTDGFLYATSTPVEQCTALVVIDSDEYALLTDYTTITGADVVEAYSFGFALVFFGWAISFPIKAAIRAINSV